MKPGGSGISRDDDDAELSVNPTAHRRPEPITDFPLSITIFPRKNTTKLRIPDYAMATAAEDAFSCESKICSG